MPFLKFSRDKRGVEYFCLVQPTANRRGKVRQRVLYWFRSPPDVKVGREPFDPGVRRALEAQNPDVTFDWRAIVETPIPSADADKWRERRRAERAARHAAAAEERSEPEAEPVGEPASAEDVEAADPQPVATVSLGEAQPSNVATGNAPRESDPQRGGAGDDVAAAARHPQPAHPFRRHHPASLLETDPPGARRLRRVRIGATIVAVGLAMSWMGRSLAPRLLSILTHVQGFGPAAPVAFILVYALAVVAFIPGSLLTIAGGAVFGLMRGVVYALIGATLGSTLAFLIGRYVARRFIARRLAAMPRFTAIERAISARGRRIVFLLRLSPVVPFNFLNYALGLTTISLWDFVAASLGTIPGAFVYAYAGKVTGEALALAGQAQVPKDASYYAVLVAGLAATVAATTVATRTAKRALQDV